jgi:hypothetical protein
MLYGIDCYLLDTGLPGRPLNHKILRYLIDSIGQIDCHAGYWILVACEIGDVRAERACLMQSLHEHPLFICVYRRFDLI